FHACEVFAHFGIPTTHVLIVVRYASSVWTFVIGVRRHAVRRRAPRARQSAGQGGDGAPAAALRGEPRPVGCLGALYGALRRRQPPVDRARPGVPGGRPPRRDLSL